MMDGVAKVPVAVKVAAVKLTASEQLTEDFKAIIGRLDEHEDKLDAYDKDLGVRDAQLDNREASLNEREAKLVHQEAHLKDIRKIAADRKAEIEALKDADARSSIKMKALVKELEEERKKRRTAEDMYAKTLKELRELEVRSELKVEEVVKTIERGDSIGVP